MNIFVLGNLGSGKGTLIEGLASKLKKTKIVTEKFENNPFLSLFAQDGNRWSLPLQLNFLVDYVDAFQEAKKSSGSHLLFDAGVWTNWYVFMESLKHQNIITKDEYNLYVKYAKRLIAITGYPKPDVIFYLKTSPEICKKRIEIRGLPFQRNTSLSYLKSLESYYAKMILKFKQGGINVVEVDNEKNDIRNNDYLLKIIKMGNV